jgi:hypothetical protein
LALTIPTRPTNEGFTCNTGGTSGIAKLEPVLIKLILGLFGLY